MVVFNSYITESYAVWEFYLQKCIYLVIGQYMQSKGQKHKVKYGIFYVGIITDLRLKRPWQSVVTNKIVINHKYNNI